MTGEYLADFSLALINRTGAYYISKDVVENLSQHFARVRYWRFHFHRCPNGLSRKFIARLMLRDIDRLSSTKLLLWPDTFRSGKRLPTVFFDPLYVLRSRLCRDDIVLCHDIGPISHPELFPASVARNYKAAYEMMRKIKPGVIFVSAASRHEFEGRFGTDFRFLEVIPLYFRPVAKDGEQQPVKGVSRPFFLTVGALETRKNYLRVMEAFVQSKLYEQGYSYVFCGPRGNLADKIKAVAAGTPGVLCLPYVTDAELRWLYANAAGFVLPSLLEGFGVPALEAASYGLVPLVSRGGAQEEAIGGHGVLVDPTSVHSIVEGLITLASMGDAEKEALAKQLQEHARSLTVDRFLLGWESMLQNNGPPETANYELSMIR